MKPLLKKITQYASTTKQRLAAFGLLSFAYFFVFSVDVAYAAPVWLLWLGARLKEYAESIAAAAVVLMLLSMTTYVAGLLFDFSLSWTVLDAGNILSNNSALMTGIKAIWVLFRDIANILIIGIFVFIALATILGIEKYSYKKMMVSLLTVALLINFSFFFTQVVVDISNWTAVQAFNSMVPDGETPRFTLVATTDGGSNLVGAEGTYSISEGFMSAMQIQSWYKILGTTALQATTAPLLNIIFMATTFILMLAITLLFFRVAFILISRWLILIILMMTSSLAFAAMLIPSLNKYWLFWRNGLVYNAIVAPALLMMLYAVALISDTILSTFPNTLSRSPQDKEFWTTWIWQDKYWNEIAISLTGSILVILLIYAAIRVATMLANNAAESAGGMGKAINSLMSWLPNMAEGGVFAAGGWAGRNSIGKGFQSMADAAGNRMDGSGGIRNMVLGSLRSGLGAVAGQSFDARQSKGLQGLLKASGTNLGTGIKDGFKKIQEAKDKKNKELDSALDKRIRSEAEKDLEIKSRMNAVDKEAQDKAATAREELTKGITKLTEQQGELTQKISEDTTQQGDVSATIETKKQELESAGAEKAALEQKIKDEGGAISDTDGAINIQEKKIEDIRKGLERNKTMGVSSEALQTYEASLAKEGSHLSDLKKRRDDHNSNMTRLDELNSSIPEQERTLGKLEGDKKAIINRSKNNQAQYAKLTGDLKAAKDKKLASLKESTVIQKRMDDYDKQVKSYSDQLSGMRELDAYPENYETVLKDLTKKRQSKLDIINNSPLATDADKIKTQKELEEIEEKIVKLDKSKNMRDAAAKKLRQRVGMSKGERADDDATKKNLKMFGDLLAKEAKKTGGPTKVTPMTPSTASDGNTTTY